MRKPKKEEITIRFGERLREARKTRGLSQEALADLCDLDRTYVSGVERGVRNPSLKNIGRFAKGLGLSIEDLCRGIDTPNARKDA